MNLFDDKAGSGVDGTHKPGGPQATERSVSKGLQLVSSPASLPVVFEVFGVPIPKGSTKAFNVKGKKFPVVTADNEKTKPWAQQITATAMVLKQVPLWTGPVSLEVRFNMPKPMSLPKRRFSYPTKKPDMDKLLRTVKDALKGIFYKDDAQVVEVLMRKCYAEVPSVIVTIYPVAPESSGDFLEWHV